MHELDHALQHYGVKGMKWGVRRTKEQLSKSAKSGVQTYKKKRKESLDKYHDKKRNKKRYIRDYEKHFKKTNDHYKSVSRARGTATNRNIKRGVVATPAVLYTGLVAARTFHLLTTDPEAVMAGKNIVQAFKDSPIRYVDGAKMTNVINGNIMAR